MGMYQGRVPHGPTRQLTRRRSDTYTVYRQDGSVSGWGEESDSYTTRTAALDLSATRRGRTERATGDDHDVQASGRCLPDADIEEGDVVVYGTDAMEVTEAHPHPPTGETQFLTLTLRNRADIDPETLP